MASINGRNPSQVILSAHGGLPGLPVTGSAIQVITPHNIP
jgi:hypothetical protein